MLHHGVVSTMQTGWFGASSVSARLEYALLNKSSASTLMAAEREKEGGKTQGENRWVSGSAGKKNRLCSTGCANPTNNIPPNKNPLPNNIPAISSLTMTKKTEFPCDHIFMQNLCDFYCVWIESGRGKNKLQNF